MKRKLLILVIPMVFAVVGIGAHFGFRWAHRRVVNREFCEYRNRLADVGKTYIDGNRDITSDGALASLYRDQVVKTVCSRTSASVADWLPDIEKLDPGHREQLEAMQREECRLAEACGEPGESKEWVEISEWMSPRTRREPILADGEVGRLGASIAKLRELMPLVRVQRETDASVLCASARDLSRARKLVGFYESRCPACSTRRDHRKMSSLAAAEESRLRQNIEQFKIKWSADPTLNLDCLKGL